MGYTHWTRVAPELFFLVLFVCKMCFVISCYFVILLLVVFWKWQQHHLQQQYYSCKTFSGAFHLIFWRVTNISNIFSRTKFVVEKLGEPWNDSLKSIFSFAWHQTWKNSLSLYLSKCSVWMHIMIKIIEMPLGMYNDTLLNVNKFIMWQNVGESKN